MNGVKRIIIKSAPNPYIGQYGPDRNPLFIHFLCIILQYTTSHSQPITLYINKYKKYVLKIISITSMYDYIEKS